MVALDEDVEVAALAGPTLLAAIEHDGTDVVENLIDMLKTVLVLLAVWDNDI